jgi:Skp family chaperone for outer membrane proteins
VGVLWLAIAVAQAHAQTAVPDSSGPIEPAQPTRILVIDVDKLRSAGTPDMDAAFTQFVTALSSSRGATLILDRKAVVVASPGFDVTALAETAMDNFRKTGALPPLEQGPLAPVARLEVLDRAALLRSSVAGKNIEAQVQALTNGAENELRPRSLALKAVSEELQWQVSSLPVDEIAQDQADFTQRRDAFHQKVQERQDQIRAAVALAQKQVEAVAGPLVQQIMADDGANILVDRMAVVIGDPRLDITPRAITKLDAALTHVDVVLSVPETK